jgi:phosphoglycerate kinase
MAIRSIRDLNIKGKRVLCRVDFNVSVDKATGAISDDTRIVAALPTIKDLLSRGGRLVLCSHFGRPDGKPNPKYTLKPIAERLANHLGAPVAFATDCIGDEAKKVVGALKDGEVCLLENLRYHAGEEENEEAFCKQLKDLGDVYVNDAFGAAHRAHASVYGVAKMFTDRASGYLLEKEINYLTKATKSPERPFVVILGGAKVSDKIAVIENLLPKCDAMLIGGAMAYTFLKAQGVATGQSLVEADKVELAKTLLHQAKKLNKKLMLPVDHVVAAKIEANAPNQIVMQDQIPAEQMGLDVGPKTVEAFAAEIKKAKMVVWNGPLGVFEVEPFNKGTFAIARAIAESGATAIIGGGESVAAVKKAKVADKMAHISTGGGASLEFLEGKELPGVAALA